MKAMISQVVPSQYRDLNLYPIMPEIINILKPSIKKTGFWGGLRARPMGNVITLSDGTKLTEENEINEYLMGLDSAFDENGKPLFAVEQAFGHHRVAAALECGVEVAEFSITFIGNDVMLQMMAEENHRDASNNIAVKLETYRQTQVELESQAAEHESFEQYLEKYSFFETPKAWKNARTQGVGFRVIHKFLGESWPEMDVRGGMAALKDINDGVYEQEQVIGMPSMSAVQQFGRLCTAIRKQEWPEYLKDKYVADCSAIICDPEIGSTVKILKTATTAVGKENHPVEYLKKQKYTKWDLTKEILRLSTELNMEVAEFLEVDGLKDFPGLDEAVKAAKAKQDKDAERAAAAAAGDPLPEDGDADPVGEGDLEGDIPDVADGIVADAEADAAAGVALPPLVDDVPEGEVSVAALSATFAESANVFAAQASRLVGKIDSIDGDSLDLFGSAFESVFSSIVKVGMEAYGRADLMKMMDDADPTK